MSMHAAALARLDLNLLVTLHMLLDTLSVSRTAENLHLSQPAISKALLRLRETFNDPLFTRVSRGLVPTPYALSLQEPLSRWIEEVAGMLTRDPFEAKNWTGELSIATNEFFHITFMPLLVASLSQRAPGMKLRIYSQFHNQLAGLESGELDFVINLAFETLGANYDSEVVYRDTPQVYAREGHPLHSKRRGKQQVSLYEFQRIQLLLPDMDKYSSFRKRLAQNSPLPTWPSGCQTDNLIAALAILCRTDYVLPGPGLLAGFANPALAFKPVKSPNLPTFTLDQAMVSHERTRLSPVHQWLRELIRELMAGFGNNRPPGATGLKNIS